MSGGRSLSHALFCSCTVRFDRLFNVSVIFKREMFEKLKSLNSRMEVGSMETPDEKTPPNGKIRGNHMKLSVS